MIYSIVSVVAVPRSESVMCLYVHLLSLETFIPYGLSQNAESPVLWSWPSLVMFRSQRCVVCVLVPACQPHVCFFGARVCVKLLERVRNRLNCGFLFFFFNLFGLEKIVLET